MRTELFAPLWKFLFLRVIWRGKEFAKAFPNILLLFSLLCIQKQYYFTLTTPDDNSHCIVFPFLQSVVLVGWSDGLLSWTLDFSSPHRFSGGFSQLHSIFPQVVLSMPQSGLNVPLLQSFSWSAFLCRLLVIVLWIHVPTWLTPSLLSVDTSLTSFVHFLPPPGLFCTVWLSINILILLEMLW